MSLVKTLLWKKKNTSRSNLTRYYSEWPDANGYVIEQTLCYNMYQIHLVKKKKNNNNNNNNNNKDTFCESTADTGTTDNSGLGCAPAILVQFFCFLFHLSVPVLSFTYRKALE